MKYKGLPLNKVEAFLYNKNRFLAACIRRDLLKALKGFSYGKVFTEVRSNGKCRTKFWIVNSSDSKRALRWLKNNWGHISYITFNEVEFIPGKQQRGISITIG